MLCSICIGKALIRANFWYLKFSYWPISFDVIHDASLLFNSAPAESNYAAVESHHSATDFVYSAAWLGYPAAWVAILSPLCPKIYFLILPCVKKLLDFWMIFLMQIVPHCLIFYFLNMQ
jgi:hypothetical protein